ncbi:hypothetical protein J5Y04_15920 [Kitasatospora sp. RG8]|uniref:hypothetical protein n=1 Tax=Kitasatospora sp. RG8 TaxID=2820815 RepID=UPI001AE0CB9D|nr:hypothetical protein [Kitasatospora sp. RG8]MBP0451020.1 hypothetical protein [Kitasatospora sp. RG8]
MVDDVLQEERTKDVVLTMAEVVADHAHRHEGIDNDRTRFAGIGSLELDRTTGPARTPDLIPLTVPEIRRLTTDLARPVRRNIAHVLHWSRWRRRRQRQARTSHYKRRGHSPRTESSSRQTPLQY